MAKRLVIGGFSVFKYYDPIFWLHQETPVGWSSIRIGLSNDSDNNQRLEDRIRPSGENGSGPYFHSVQTLDGGIRTYYNDYNNDVCVTWGDYNDVTSFNKGKKGREYSCLTKYWAHGDRFVAVSARAGDFSSYSNEFLAQAYLLTRLTDKRGYYYQTSISGSIPHTSGEDASAVIAELFEKANAAFDELKERFSALDPAKTTWTKRVSPRLADELHFDLQDTGYRYNEYGAFEWWRMTGVLPNRYASLSRAAYIDACDRLPEAQCNSVANVLEAAGAVAGLIAGKKPNLKSWKELWLAYRYSYSTTKSDVEEYAELTRRLCALATASTIKSYGYCSDGYISCQCTITLDASGVLPKSTVDWLKSYGFKLSTVNMWDMVPYSFIADWFLHIGDFLSWLESMENSIELPVLSCWTTFETAYEGRSTYIRVPGHEEFRLPYISYHKTSQKTVFKRILDGIALFT